MHSSLADIWITIIAGVLYFIQAWVSSKQMPQEQRQMTYMKEVRMFCNIATNTVT
jgi:membrane protein insertase Oxa1/YidC/SpoIIIJ